MSRLKNILLILIGIMAMVIAAMLDRSAAAYMRESGVEGFLRSNHVVRETLKLPGTYGFTAACAIVVLIIRKPKWYDALFVAIAPIVSGLNGLFKWALGRHRPYTWGRKKIDELRPFDFDHFCEGFPGLLYAMNLSFPSGHACMAFATATALAILWPRWMWAFFALAGVTAIERIAENAHWCSDIVGGAILGVGGVHAIRWLWNKWFESRALNK